MFANYIWAGKSSSNPEEAILTTQQEITPKRRGKMKRQSTEKVLEGLSKQATKGRKHVTQEISII
jgi:hypothetical protein